MSRTIFRVFWDDKFEEYPNVEESDKAETAWKAAGTSVRVEEESKTNSVGPGSVRDKVRLRLGLRDKLRVLDIAERNRNRRIPVRGTDRAARDEPMFTKDQAAYVSKSRWPFITCGTCVFWKSDEKACKVVTEMGVPDLSLIGQDGLCNLFSYRGAKPSAIRIKLSEKLVGRGEGESGPLSESGRRAERLMKLRGSLY